MFGLFQFDQLLVAAEIGRADDIIALVAEGADIDYKNLVRSLVFSFRLIHCMFECIVSQSAHCIKGKY